MTLNYEAMTYDGELWFPLRSAIAKRYTLCSKSSSFIVGTSLGATLLFLFTVNIQLVNQQSHEQVCYALFAFLEFLFLLWIDVNDECFKLRHRHASKLACSQGMNRRAGLTIQDPIAHEATAIIFDFDAGGRPTLVRKW